VIPAAVVRSLVLGGPDQVVGSRREPKGVKLSFTTGPPLLLVIEATLLW
jgi:hypothetical protein